MKKLVQLPNNKNADLVNCVEVRGHAAEAKLLALLEHGRQRERVNVIVRFNRGL